VRIEGHCHCENISFTLDWPNATALIPARACDCSFCLRHGNVWTSHPAALLAVRIKNPAQASCYRFGTETAIFHICRTCGVVPVATSAIDEALHAVVNVNTFVGVAPERLERSVAHLGEEDVSTRTERRGRNWIANVQMLVERA